MIHQILLYSWYSWVALLQEFTSSKITKKQQFILKTEAYTELQSNESTKIQNLRKLSPTNLNDHTVLVYHYFDLLMSVLLNLRMTNHEFSISFYLFK